MMDMCTTNGEMYIEQLLYSIALDRFYLFGMNAIKDFDTVFLDLSAFESEKSGQPCRISGQETTRSVSLSTAPLGCSSHLEKVTTL
jgi:hypothetical protein